MRTLKKMNERSSMKGPGVVETSKNQTAREQVVSNLKKVVFGNEWATGTEGVPNVKSIQSEGRGKPWNQ